MLKNKPDKPHFNTGKIRSEETRRKIGLAGLGRTPWNKGKKLSKEGRKKLSDAHKGAIITKEQRTKISKSLTGRKRPPEVGKKISEGRKGLRYNLGVDHWNWKGGHNQCNYENQVIIRTETMDKKCLREGWIHL